MASVNADAADCTNAAPSSVGRLCATAFAWPMESSAAARAVSGSAAVSPESPEAYTDVISEPMTAVPSAPATWRVTSFIAEATPAFSSGTALITEPVAGLMIQPIPIARKKKVNASGG
jgi:hypothetical protein